MKRQIKGNVRAVKEKPQTDDALLMWDGSRSPSSDHILPSEGLSEDGAWDAAVEFSRSETLGFIDEASLGQRNHEKN